MLVLAITGIGNAMPVQWSTAVGGNDHYYEIIQTDSGITWATANTLANNSTYLELQGHLATITSREENLFISDDPGLGNENPYGIINCKWLGGYQPDGSPEPDGGWQWVTGEIFAYTNWNINEPNNHPDGENRVVFQHGWSSDGKEWNDLIDTCTQSGYVVEYEPVPVPSTMLLLGTGLLGMVCYGRSRFN